MSFLKHFPDYFQTKYLINSFIAYLDGRQTAAKREVIVFNRRAVCVYSYIVFLESKMFKNRKSGLGLLVQWESTCLRFTSYQFNSEHCQTNITNKIQEMKALKICLKLIHETKKLERE